MSLATLSIDLIAQIANLQAGMEKATRLAEKNAAAIEARYANIGGVAASVGSALAGAFASGVLVQFVTNTANAIDALNDAADATGATVEQLSALEQVALRNGESLDTVTGIMVKFNAVLKEADKGSVPAQVLEAIGLQAAELRRLDPADALKEVAVALQGFEDNGNKARIVQELFGKSVREAAPFLKDLAEAGELNATVTSQQAKEAEKFNKQLAEYSTNVTNFGRALVGDLLPALNDMALRIKGINEAATNDGGGLAKTLLVPLETAAVLGVNVAYVLKQIGTEIGGIAAQAGAVLRGDFGGAMSIGQAMKADAAAARIAVDERTAQLLGLSKVQQQLSGLPVASYSNEGRNAGKRLGDIAGLKAIGAPKKTEFRLSGGDLISSVFGGKLADSLAKDGPLTAGNLLGIEEALKGVNGDLTLTFELLSQTPSFKLAETRKEMQTLASAFEQGLITAEQFTEAAQTRLGLLPQEVKPAVDEMQEYLKQFQRNVQDILGDGLESILKGDFDSISRSFGDMLRKMAAQALAADLSNQLFGKMGADGARSGGVFSSLLSTLGGFLGFANGGVFSGGKVTPFASGGVVGGPTLFGMRGGLGLMGEAGPEAIMPLRRGRDGKLGVAGGGTTVVNNYHVAAGVSRNELVTALGAMSQNLEAKNMMLLRAKGVV